MIRPWNTWKCSLWRRCLMTWRQTRDPRRIAETEVHSTPMQTHCQTQGRVLNTILVVAGWFPWGKEQTIALWWRASSTWRTGGWMDWLIPGQDNLIGPPTHTELKCRNRKGLHDERLNRNCFAVSASGGVITYVDHRNNNENGMGQV